MPLRSQVFTSSGTWTPPAGVTGAWIMMVGGGGGGSQITLGGGGGAGEFCERVMIPAGASVAVTVGTGGVATGGGGWFNGTNSAAGPFTVLASSSGPNQSANPDGQNGGGVRGGNFQTSPGTRGFEGSTETNTFVGGCSGASGQAGGGGGRDVGSPGTNLFGTGGAAHPTGAGAGAASMWGAGGNGGDGTTNGTAPLATAYGASGGGASNGQTPGSGANGVVVVFWIS